MKSTGFIKDGVYYRGTLRGVATQGDQPLHKGWSHDRQREEHRADIVQPYKDNQPNPEFIQLYPDQAAKYGFLKDK